MKDLSKYQEKVILFMTQLQNAYLSEEEREYAGKLELIENELTEDFTAMLQALNMFYSKITGDDVDFIGFTHICNRLAVQHCIEKK